MATVQHSHSAS